MRIASFSRRARLTAAGTLTAGLLASPLAPGAFAYELPPATNAAPADPALQQLQQISRATSALAASAKKALVFISVAMPAVRGRPSGGPVDPFDFFFGPPGGQGGPGGGMPAPRQEGVGSGFFVDLDHGYVITNNHVIEGADVIDLKLANGETRKGKVVGRDDKTDVAVVKVDGAFDKRDLGVLRLGNSDSLSVGDFVVALGAPFGLEASLSQGVVSATGRGNLDITQLGDFIQTDAAINPGNSGGPLLNAAGEAVGMNTAIFSRSGTHAGIGFAVPSNIVRTVAEQLIQDGRLDRGYIGLSLQEVGPDIAQGLKLPEGTRGALIAQVQPGSPAAKAGLQPGDVVVKLNGRAVTSISQLTNAIGLMKPGADAKLIVLREGKERELAARIAAWPREGRLASRSSQSGDQGGDEALRGARFGIAVEPLDRREKEELRLESDKGALITSVDPNSQAARAGLRPGDLIVAADNKPVQSPEAFETMQRGKDRMLLRVERSGDFFFVPLSRS